MNIFKNPILITFTRMNLRTSFWAAVIFAALFNLVVLLNFDREAPSIKYLMIYTYARLIVFSVWYLFTVQRSIFTDYEKGLFEHNMLSPLSPKQIIAGYTLGPLVSPFTITIMSSFVTFYFSIYLDFSFYAWMQLELLSLSTFFLFSLFGLLIGLISPKAPSKSFFLAAGIVALTYAFTGEGSLFLGNFLLPTLGISSVFSEFTLLRDIKLPSSAMVTQFFGINVDTTISTLAIQAGVAALLWKSVSERIKSIYHISQANFFPILTFFCLAILQVSFLWGITEPHTVLPSVILFIVLSLGLLTVFSPQKHQTSFISVSGNKWKDLFLEISDGFAFPSLFYSLFGAICLYFITQSATLNQSPFLGVVLGYFFLVFGAGLWTDFCFRFFKLKALALTLLGLISYNIFPALFGLVLGNKIFLLSSPVLWTFFSANDSSHVDKNAAAAGYATLYHGTILLILAGFWYIKWVKRHKDIDLR